MYKWIECKISKGMFPNEKTVSIDALNGVVSFFITGYESFFKQKNNKSFIKIDIVEDYNNNIAVSLPVESLEDKRLIKVKKEWLKNEV
jgi:hypothetical protein